MLLFRLCIRLHNEDLSNYGSIGSQILFIVIDLSIMLTYDYY